MDRIPDKIDSKFRYVLLASHRAEQIMRGSSPKLELNGAKTVRVAMEEISQDLVEWEYGPEPEPVVAAPAEGEEGAEEHLGEEPVGLELDLD